MKVNQLHRAIPSQGAVGGVLVLHPWWGLNDDTRGYADRLAAAGFAAVAPDFYDGEVATAIEDADRLSTDLNEDAADAIAWSAVDLLAEAVADPSVRLGAIGFSMGSAWALWLPVHRPEIVASVTYYGTLEGPSLTRARVPVLGHFAGTDEYEPDEEVVAFERSMRLAGRDVEIHRYPGAGHWFAEPSREDAYDAAAADLAFERTVAFLRRHLVDAG